MKKYKFLKGLFLVIGIMNVISFFDTLLAKESEAFHFLSFSTSKTINLIIYLVLAVILFAAALRIKSK